MVNYTFKDRQRELTKLRNDNKNFDNLINELGSQINPLFENNFHIFKNSIEIILAVLILTWTVFLAQRPIFGFWHYTQFVIIFIILSRIMHSKNSFNSRLRIFYDHFDLSKKSLELIKFTYINNLNILIGICEKGIIEESRESNKEKEKKIHILYEEMNTYKVNISIYGGCKVLFLNSINKDIEDYLALIDKITYIVTFTSLNSRSCEMLLEEVCNMGLKIDRPMLEVCGKNIAFLKTMRLQLNSFKSYFFC